MRQTRRSEGVKEVTMTRKEAIQKHRKMWSWIADNPGKDKRDYLEKFDPESKLISDCYLCEYAEERGRDCEDCLVSWPSGGSCYAVNELYEIWGIRMFRGHYTEASRIARQIAELPER